ncbi:MAG: hypothetical protein ABL967_10280 [Bryobacteraceae bacterium]
MKNKLDKVAVMVSLVFLSQTMVAGERTAPLQVSATVQARARWIAVSSNEVTVGVTMYPNVRAQVWAAKGECGTPVSAHQIADSGIHKVTFTPQELDGTDQFCVASGDGAVQSAANRPR